MLKFCECDFTVIAHVHIHTIFTSVIQNVNIAIKQIISKSATMYLSKRGFEAIKESGELYGKIADQLDVSPITLKDKIKRNDPALTQFSVLKLIKEYTGLTDSELLTDSKIIA